jgi:hypothetical protein
VTTDRISELRDVLVERLKQRIEADELSDGVLAAAVALLKMLPAEPEETIRSATLTPTLQKYARHAQGGPRLVKGN